METLRRKDTLPVIHVRGSFYEVGHNVGRTFSSLIKSVVDNHLFLNRNYLPVYNTKEGKIVYEETLKAVTDYYPNYVKELEGLSDGSGVPFYKLFLLHMDDVLPNCASQIAESNQGCSTVCLNMNSNEIIGHTEDALKEVLNNIYVLNVKYTDSETQEHFTAFCYAGLLPGYAMGYNKHGLVYTVNIIGAKYLGRGRLPRTFVTRALLAADSLESAIKALECSGLGIADAISVNLTFLDQPGERIFYNIEVSPAHPISNKSAIDILKIPPGSVHFHANKFVRLQVPELDGRLFVGSGARHETRDSYNLVDSKSVHDLLSDTSHPVCTLFRTTEKTWTVAVGFFDLIKRTWSIYLDKPNKSEPIAVFSLDL